MRIARRVGVGVLLGVLSCAGEADSKARLTAITREYPCTTIPGIAIRADSTVSKAQACALVRLALHAMASDRDSRIGLVPADTARVTRATVRSVMYTGLRGTPDARTWQVELGIPSHFDDVSVDIDQLSESVGVGPGERAHGTIIMPDS